MYNVLVLIFILNLVIAIAFVFGFLCFVAPACFSSSRLGSASRRILHTIYHL